MHLVHGWQVASLESISATGAAGEAEAARTRRYHVCVCVCQLAVPAPTPVPQTVLCCREQRMPLSSSKHMPTKTPRCGTLTADQIRLIEQNRARARLLRLARQQSLSASAPSSTTVSSSSSEDLSSSSSKVSTASRDTARIAAAKAAVKKLDFDSM
jgi:hypothetical protein